MAKFNEDATQTGTQWAMIEMAAVVDQIYDKLPEGEREGLGSDTFHTFVLHTFDYTQFPVPQLIGTVDEVAAWFVEEFELGQRATQPGM